MLKTAVAIRHLDFEDLGAFEAPLARAGYAIRYHDVGKNPVRLLDPISTPLLIVLGGPMGVYEADRYPFISEELQLLEERIAANKPTLGICLGAQLIARACGAHVYPGHAKEIGFGRVELTEAGRRSALSEMLPDYQVLHWHGDTFDLPDGAERLCSNENYPNQAFSKGSNVLALQFHIEAGGAGLERWTKGHAAELAAAGIDPGDLLAQATKFGPAVNAIADMVLTNWLAGLHQ